MALFLKQDFTPPILSRKWIAMKCRPNMLLYSRNHIISILESGLLFREDSVEVEQETCPYEVSKWLTHGERLMAVVGGGLCLYVMPPRSLNRSLILHGAAYASIPLAIRLWHRSLCRGTIDQLLTVMRDYLALARRAAACVKESTTIKYKLSSLSAAVESLHTMLCRQQLHLAALMSRAAAALLGNVPWLKDSDITLSLSPCLETDNSHPLQYTHLMKIHHAFMVVQSTLLKHIALAHSMPSAHVQKLYKNHNERLHWIHTVLMTRLHEEFKENYEALERMYRLLKNYGHSDTNTTKKLGSAVNNSWLYSDVHSGVARTSLELKLANEKCSDLDMFLDTCALHKQELDVSVLSKDIDDLIDIITKCLNTIQGSQIRLKKIQNKFVGDTESKPDDQNDGDHLDNDVNVLKIEDKDPEARDEVFYFVKTEDDDFANEPASDLTTGPGRKEKETTKIVLNELRRKLVVREGVMRERERQALRKTMPELQNDVPEFPRQMTDDFLARTSIFTKLLRTDKLRISQNVKLSGHLKRNFDRKRMKFKLEYGKYSSEDQISSPYYEANSKLNAKSKYLSFTLKPRNRINIKRWYKKALAEEIKNESSVSEGLSDVEANATNRTVTQAVNGHVNGDSSLNFEARNYRFSKKDLELSQSSDSDEDYCRDKQIELLKDARRLRAARKKNYPSVKPVIDKIEDADEGSKPIEYNFGAGLAMASVLQISSQKKMPSFVREEVFTGDGEVSNDSGNDEDA